MAYERNWFDIDTAFIPAHHQPAALMDLALSRGVNPDKLFRGTRLFHQQLLEEQPLISPQQFLLLIQNTQRLLSTDDNAFLFGQRLLPGHCGSASEFLHYTQNLHTTIEHLINYRALLSPLVTPRLYVDEHYAHLFWINNSGASDQHRFLIESAMVAMQQYCRAITGSKLPWEFSFSYTKPNYIEQYWVYLGEQIAFSQQVDAMRIPKSHLFESWQQPSALSSQLALQECVKQKALLGFETGFLDALFCFLEAQIQHNPKLEQTAHYFSMSSATLKRNLKKHNTSFQEQLDKVRKHIAMQLIQVKGFSNEEVASYLGIYDKANFRRSFKRWTGLAPNQYRSAFFR